MSHVAHVLLMWMSHVAQVMWEMISWGTHFFWQIQTSHVAHILHIKLSHVARFIWAFVSGGSIPWHDKTKYVMSHTQTSHVAHVNESCRTQKWVMSHMYGARTRFISHRSCGRWFREEHIVFLQIQMSHVAHVWRTYTIHITQVMWEMISGGSIPWHDKTNGQIQQLVARLKLKLYVPRSSFLHYPKVPCIGLFWHLYRTLLTSL